ncbi:phage tail protein [Neorhizobium sp. T786]|uniref:phage tail protein n=1 Tax=Pseudorhizobium xiangyangii TaxID=2883104 RepID=UPI001CFF88B0|nr:phage tail protein [Neorhizobium xiangyangii]MCB5203951.1 phage tail protein [Neorhizobium xiangyangii]
MSAFQPNGALLSIGGAILYTIGLNPQRLSYSSEARFPAHAVPGGLVYQKTGLGPELLTIEAKTLPHVFGGLDAYAILKAHHKTQATIPLIRLRGNYLGEASGLCVIEALDADEERLHPFDGIGRQVDVTIGLILLPRSMAGSARQSIITLGGLL